MVPWAGNFCREVNLARSASFLPFNTLGPNHVYIRCAIFRNNPTTYIYVWGKKGIIIVFVISWLFFSFESVY